MKKLFLTGIVLLLLMQTFACDICGCSSGNYYLGLFPQFRKHFFGIRYTFRSFNSQVANDATQFSKDFYQTMELWSGWNIGRKWQVVAFVPYNINKQTSDDGVKKTNGLGDVSFILNYHLLNTRSGHKNNMVSQQLLVGGGLKLPTGKFNVDPNDIVPTANAQAGSGSVDFILNALYTYHINNWGVNSNLNYKINSSADAYKFGNRLTASAFVFHSISTAKVTFNPNAGVLYENLRSNKLDKVKVDDTGGNAVMASGGLEINFSKVAVGFNTQLPVVQNFSNGQTDTKIRGMMHVTFIL
ncbi:MAG TPA: hypothetical protein VIM07_16215 [Chitinophagaceae bacterium]